MNHYRPCLVLALTCPRAAAEMSCWFRRAGWDVYPAEGGAQLRRLARLLDADLLLLDLALDGESGWLTAAKLRHERPETRIVLLGEDTARNRRLAAFVGVSDLLPRHDALPTRLGPARVAA